MVCNKGYKGNCCCECKYQFKIHVCSCEKCSKVTGYICTVFYEMDKKTREVSHTENKHGCCEMFSKLNKGE